MDLVTSFLYSNKYVWTSIPDLFWNHSLDCSPINTNPIPTIIEHYNISIDLLLIIRIQYSGLIDLVSICYEPLIDTTFQWLWLFWVLRVIDGSICYMIWLYLDCSCLSHTVYSPKCTSLTKVGTYIWWILNRNSSSWFSNPMIDHSYVFVQLSVRSEWHNLIRNWKVGSDWLFW